MDRSDIKRGAFLTSDHRPGQTKATFCAASPPSEEDQFYDRLNTLDELQLERKALLARGAKLLAQIKSLRR